MKKIRLTEYEKLEYIISSEKRITQLLLKYLHKDNLPENNIQLWHTLLESYTDKQAAKVYTSITNQARKNIKAALKTSLNRWK